VVRSLGKPKDSDKRFFKKKTTVSHPVHSAVVADSPRAISREVDNQLRGEGKEPSSHKARDNSLLSGQQAASKVDDIPASQTEAASAAKEASSSNTQIITASFTTEVGSKGEPISGTKLASDSPKSSPKTTVPSEAIDRQSTASSEASSSKITPLPSGQSAPELGAGIELIMKSLGTLRTAFSQQQTSMERMIMCLSENGSEQE
jgi:hypothetical protein